MKQFFGMSQNGNLQEAVKGLSNPQLIMLLSNNDQFEAHVKKLEELYPKVPSIGCIGMSYDTKVVEKGVGVVAFYDGVSATANVLEEVKNDFSQSVYLLEDKNVSEVYVEEGQKVSEGDPLIAYDMTLSELEMEMKELDVATTANKLEAAKKQLEKLRAMKPISRNPAPAPTPVAPPQPTPEPEQPEPAPEPQMTGPAYNYITPDSEPSGGAGTAEEPYVYLCMPGCYVYGAFINGISQEQENPVYVSLEIHKKNVLTGKLLGSWKLSGEGGLPMVEDDSRWSVATRSQIVEEEEEDPEDDEWMDEEPEDVPEPEEPSLEIS